MGKQKTRATSADRPAAALWGSGGGGERLSREVRGTPGRPSPIGRGLPATTRRRPSQSGRWLPHTAEGGHDKGMDRERRERKWVQCVCACGRKKCLLLFFCASKLDLHWTVVYFSAGFGGEPHYPSRYRCLKNRLLFAGHLPLGQEEDWAAFHWPWRRKYWQNSSS